MLVMRPRPLRGECPAQVGALCEEISHEADGIARRKRRIFRSGRRARIPVPPRALERLRGPGGLYNAGNFLGLAVGIAVQLAQAPRETSAAGAVAHYLAGDLSGVMLTLATLIFIFSGEAYHRAWANGFPPDRGIEPAWRPHIRHRRAGAWRRPVDARAADPGGNVGAAARHRQIRQRAAPAQSGLLSGLAVDITALW